MRAWIVRFASLYVFTLVVLLLIGLLLPSVRVGWAALWASVLLTAATIWLKPLISRAFTRAAAKSASERTAVGEKLVQYAIVFIVELIVWVLVVLFSGVRVGGFFWGWVIPPILLLVAWVVYDLVDDRIRATAGDLYDRASTGIRPSKGAADADATGSAIPSAAAREDVDELRDGLTAEQRRMLDELGKS
ncbi:hypothetical protein [Microbacterium sp.]|uniref:hypothetical protein n=1 Tax=Microbacterium sp. TaxID=51671 RepID=UPI003C74B323